VLVLIAIILVTLAYAHRNQGHKGFPDDASQRVLSTTLASQVSTTKSNVATVLANSSGFLPIYQDKYTPQIQWNSTNSYEEA
jgi:hypothetical protein